MMLAQLAKVFNYLIIFCSFTVFNKLKEAGIPDGCVNVCQNLSLTLINEKQIIHGTKDTVNFICRHPDIKAISLYAHGV